MLSFCVDVTARSAANRLGAFRINSHKFRRLDGNGQMTPKCIDGHGVLQNIGRHWGASASHSIAKVEQGVVR